MSKWRKQRNAHEGRPELVGALASYLRTEQETEATQARRSLPAPLDDEEAVTAAKVAYQEVAGSYSAPSQTRVTLNLGIYLAAYNPTEARIMLQRAAVDGPSKDAGEAYAWLGVVLADLGDIDGAIAAYQAAIDTRDADHAPRSMVNLGELHLERGHLAAARSSFELAISSGHPTYAARAQVDLAGVLIQEGDLDGAQAIYQQAAGSDDARILQVATQNLGFIDAHGDLDDRGRAGIVLQQLISVPDWYQTRQILNRHAALLADVEALIREVERESQMQEPTADNQESLGPFLNLLVRVREIGVEGALGEMSGLGDDVPLDMRLAFLQAEEASQRFANGGGQSSLTDARTAVIRLIAHPDWAELAPALRLDCLSRLTNVVNQLYQGTGDIDYLDQIARLYESAPAWAHEAGLDPAPFAEEYGDLEAARRELRHMAMLSEFTVAVAEGTAEAFIGAHPQLLDDRVLERLSSRLESFAADNPDDEVAGRLQDGLGVLRLCKQVGVHTALQTVGPADDHLMDLISGVSGTTAEELRTYLHGHPELFSEAVDIYLERSIEAAGRAAAHGLLIDSQVVELRDLRDMLRRCREIGVDAAVDELQALRPVPDARPGTNGAGQAMDELFDAMTSGGSGDVAAVLERHRDVLLSEATDATLTAMLREFEDADNAAIAAVTRRIRHRLREARIFGLSESSAVSELLALPGLPEETFRRLLQQYPELLEPVADDFLEDLVDRGDEPEESFPRWLDLVEARRRLLRDCRTLGPDAAIAAAWNNGEFLPEDLRATLAQAFEANLEMINGEVERPDAAAALWHQVTHHQALADHPYPVRVTEQYAIFHLLCHRLFRMPSAIDAAVSGFHEAVSRTAADDPWLAQRLQMLVDALTDRYELRGQPDDLHTVVSVLDRLAELTRTAGVDGGVDLDNNLIARSLLRLHDRFGTRAELDRAITMLEAASENATTDDERVKALTNLSPMLARRFRRDGRLDDLNRAIAIDADLTSQSAAEPASRAVILSNSGIHLRARYDMTRDPADLSRAIAAHEQAVQAAEPSSVDLPRYLTALGSALVTRSASSRRRRDADKAVKILTAAVEASSRSSFERPNRLNNLGAGYLHRFSITGRARHLDEAIEAFDQGLRATAADAPGYAWRASNLAYALSLRYRLRHEPSDRERATSLFRQSTTRSLAVSLDGALRAAHLWGAWATDRLSWPEAVEAYMLGVEASERLFKVQLVRGHKETWLREAGQLFNNAAHVLVRAGDPAGAATTLELGRARLLSEAIQIDRAELDRLAEIDRGSLLDRYRAAAERLRELERNWPSSGYDGLVPSVGVST